MRTMAHVLRTALGDPPGEYDITVRMRNQRRFQTPFNSLSTNELL